MIAIGETDADHVRNAMARFNQTKGVTDAERDQAFENIKCAAAHYKIEMTEENAGKAVRKIGYIDLMNIQDPKRLARKPLNNGVLTFPFFTIENVDIVDATHIVVGNDNNLPFSSSRVPEPPARMIPLRIGRAFYSVVYSARGRLRVESCRPAAAPASSATRSGGCVG